MDNKHNGWRIWGLAVWLAAGCATLTGQDRPAWWSAVEEMAVQARTAAVPVGTDSPCQFFTARAIEAVYGITDFRSGESADGGYLRANRILPYLKGHPERWQLLGGEMNQEVLEAALRRANAGSAVVAVLEGSPNGQVAVILPGALHRSASWRLEVPDAAAFLLTRPGKSFAGKGLAYAFSAADRASVRVYARAAAK